MIQYTISGKDTSTELNGGHDHRQRRQLHKTDQGTEWQLRPDIAEGQGTITSGEVHHRCR